MQPIMERNIRYGLTTSTVTQSQILKKVSERGIEIPKGINGVIKKSWIEEGLKGWEKRECKETEEKVF